MEAPAPAWLTARPVAHRGLHGRPSGCVENTLAAASAAIESNYAIECDVQLTRDGAAVVFHDDTLDRLCFATGLVRDHDAATVQRTPYRDASSSTIPTLAQFLDHIGGRVPVLIELKSRFDGDDALARAVAAVVAGRPDRLALMSFDDDLVSAAADLVPDRPHGLVAEADYREVEWPGLSAARRSDLSMLAHLHRSRPQFVAWHVHDLPAAAMRMARFAGLPLLTWTVRSEAERAVAQAEADQIIFEGFRA